MNITDIRIRKILTEGRLRAVVSVTVDDMLAIHDIKVIEGVDRLFVAMPSRKEENGVFRDIVHPISGSSRKIFEDTVLNAYRDYLENRAEQKRESKPETEQGLVETEPEAETVEV